MKKTILLFLIPLFAILIYASDSDFYEVTYVCEDSICSPGNLIDWNITVNNRGWQNIELIGIEIRDFYSDKLIAIKNISYYQPLSDDRGPVMVVLVGRKKHFSIRSILPEPNEYPFLNFYLCFDNAIREGRIVYEDIYNLKHCYKDRPFSIKTVNCLSNSDCQESQQCINESCTYLECEECQYFSNHTCINYECCSNIECGFAQNCTGNLCHDLNCKKNEFIFEHECVDFQCKENQGFRNQSCFDLQCLENEYAFNHSCLKLNCSFDEQITNHSCTKLECNSDEYILDHSCTKLECQTNQKSENHECIEIKCNLLQTLIPHKCKYDIQKILKLAMEMIIIGIILWLIYIDYRKYRRK